MQKKNLRKRRAKSQSIMFHQAQKKKHRAGVLLCAARPNEIVVHIYKRIGNKNKRETGKVK